MHTKYMDIAPIAAGLAIDILPGLLIGVYRMARTIDQTVQLVISNEEECFFLNKRIQNLVGILYRLKPDARYLSPLIMSFQGFLHECLVFLQTFLDVSLLDRILHSRRYSRTFDELNQKLNYYGNDLLLGIAARSLDILLNRLQMEYRVTTVLPNRRKNKRRQN